MEFMKHKLGILVLLLCLGIIIAAIWYCIFGFQNQESIPDGTLVEYYDTAGVMVSL